MALLRQVEMGDLLVAADVEGANDQRAISQRVEHGRIDGRLLVLGRRSAALEEEKFGAHQADALGAEVERQSRPDRAY